MNCFTTPCSIMQIGGDLETLATVLNGQEYHKNHQVHFLINFIIF